MINKLYLIPLELPIFIVKKNSPLNTNGYKDFYIKWDNILRWLIFLKNNNPLYKDIEINYQVLCTLREDGNIYHDFNSYKLN